MRTASMPVVDVVAGLDPDGRPGVVLVFGAESDPDLIGVTVDDAHQLRVMLDHALATLPDPSWS